MYEIRWEKKLYIKNLKETYYKIFSLKKKNSFLEFKWKNFQNKKKAIKNNNNFDHSIILFSIFDKNKDPNAKNILIGDK